MNSFYKVRLSFHTALIVETVLTLFQKTKSKVWTNAVQLSDQVVNIVGKGKIACYKQLLFSHNVFKSCLLLMHQNKYLWSKGLIYTMFPHFANFPLF